MEDARTASETTNGSTLRPSRGGSSSTATSASLSSPKPRAGRALTDDVAVPSGMVQRPPSGVSGGTLPSESLGLRPGHVFNGGTIAPITAAAAAAALVPVSLMLHACMPCSVCVRHVRQDGGRVRWQGVVGAWRAVRSVGSARRDALHRLSCACALSLCFRCACVPDCRCMV